MRSIYYLVLALVVLICGTASAGGPYWNRGRVERFYERANAPQVYARSTYENPFYTANPNYLPAPQGWSEMTRNTYIKETMGKPPRGLLDILVPGTYTIKQPSENVWDSSK